VTRAIEAYSLLADFFVCAHKPVHCSLMQSCIKDKNLTHARLMSLTKILATESHQDFDEETPILSLSLIPLHGATISFVALFACCL
jgi:type IV secretory pathway ATPase VirB11/archaellum biosynthesis ATPase